MKLYMVEVFDITNSDRTTWWLPTKKEGERVYETQVALHAEPRKKSDELYDSLTIYEIALHEIEYPRPRNKADLCCLLERFDARGHKPIRECEIEETWADG